MSKKRIQSNSNEYMTYLDLVNLISETDTKGIITRVNKKFCEISGYQEEELVGQPHSLVNSGHHSKSFWKQFWSTISQGRMWKGVIKNRKKDGEYYWVESTIFPKKDEKGNVLGFISVRQDISELMNKTSEVLENRKKLTLMFEHSPIGFAFCDMQGNFVEVSHKFEEITGYTFAELKQLSYWDLTPIKYKDQEDEQLKNLVETSAYGPYRKEYIQKSGKLVPVELNGFIVEDYEGIKGIWSTVEDITNKLKSETETEEQRNIALHQNRLATIGVLAAGVGHELNNPLTILMGNLYGIKKELERDAINIKKIERKISISNEASARMKEIIKDLLAFSRSGSTEEKQLIKTSDAIKSTVRLIGEIFRKRGVVIHLDLHDTDVEIEGEAGKLQQVIMNLVSNAKDALEDYEGRKEIFIDQKLDPDRNQIIITVRDTGPGISDEVMQHIFTPFYTTKQEGKGTGLGLSLSQSFIKDLGGEILAENKDGAEFRVVLPLRAGQILSIDKKQSGEELSVLIIDDEPDLLEIQSQIIQDMGITKVYTMNDPERVMDFLHKNPVDIIFTDIKMAYKNGVEIAQDVRNDPKFDNVKIFAVSGAVEQYLKASANKEMRLLFDGIINKPFDVEDFEKALGLTSAA